MKKGAKLNTAFKGFGRLSPNSKQEQHKRALVASRTKQVPHYAKRGAAPVIGRAAKRAKQRKAGPIGRSRLLASISHAPTAEKIRLLCIRPEGFIAAVISNGSDWRSWVTGPYIAHPLTSFSKTAGIGWRKGSEAIAWPRDHHQSRMQTNAREG
jgi:hypothetical protein